MLYDVNGKPIESLPYVPDESLPYVPDDPQHIGLNKFVQEMNNRAQQIGMSNSIFADPAGYNTATNRVTARDLVKLGIEACCYDRLCRIWNTNSKTIQTLDQNHRQIVCEYGDNTTSLDAAYPLLGKKNGYMPLSGGGNSFTMVAVCVVDGKIIVGAIGGATSRPNRPIAMKELMDNVHAILNNGTASTPTYYTMGCAAELPSGNPASFERKSLPYIYEYDADTQFVPASVTKVLTAITMLDYCDSVYDKIMALNADDLTTGSGQLLVDGDIINFEQALYLMMLPSSGATCRVVARTLGQKMLKKYS